MSESEHKKDKKNLLTNFFSLSALQGMNMVLPLITLPYLVRVLGVENFGLLNFSLSIIMYFSILVSFGFDLSATKEISVNRDNKKRLNEIFSAVIGLKILLTLISFIILEILIFSIDSIGKYSTLYYVTFGLIISNVIFPAWFFQGMERMKYITYIHVALKFIFLILIFILVKDENDYIYVPLLNSLGGIFGGIYSLWLIHKLFGVKFIIPSRYSLVEQFKNSYHFFLSRLATGGSRYLAVTVIGASFGNTIVGYYSLVEKLFMAFMSAGGVVSQTLYPYMSRTKNIVLFKKVFISIILLSIIILIPSMYFNEWLFEIIFNVQNETLSNIFLIMFGGSIFNIASMLVGFPLLAAFGHPKYANNSLIYVAVIYIVLLSVSAIIFNDIYLVVLSGVITNVLGLLLRIYYIVKTKILKTKG